VKTRLREKFDEYALAHSHPTNRLTHKIAIPMIILHIVAMLDWWRVAAIPALPGGFTAAYVLLVAAGAWYLTANLVLGLPVVLFGLACIPIGRALPTTAIIGVAVFGWAIQLAGHAIWEKKSPSFFRNLEHALVGPIFLVALVTGRYDIEPPGRASPPSRG
jgi:uncharacterized membrane protein YGL010W